MMELESLEIQNIRHVGDDPQIINFLRPLTLIQGNNGTGKTTIIEALNCVTSGSLPSKSLADFIHDSADKQNKVNAEITLKLNNARKQKTVITKKMHSKIKTNSDEVTRKTDKWTVQFTDDDGKEKTIPVTAANCNDMIFEHLGVSPALLENVIFCRQEKSNWPLYEPAKLKSIFDKIFKLTKYVNVKNNIEEETENLKKKINKIGEQLSQLEADVDSHNKLQNEYKKKSTEYENVLNSKNEPEKRITELCKIEIQLKDELDQIKSEAECKLKARIESAEKREEIKKVVGEKKDQLTSIKQEIEQIDKCQKFEECWISNKEEYDRYMKETKPDFDEIFQNSVEQNFEKEVQEIINNLKNPLSTAKDIFEKINKETEKLETEVSNLSFKIQSDKNKIKENENQISQAGVTVANAKSKLKEITVELKEKEAKFEQQKGYSVLFSKWEKDIETQKCCPLCDRGYEKTEQLQEFIEKIQKMKTNLPSEITILENQVLKLKKEKEKLDKVSPLVDKCENLSSKLKNNDEEYSKKNEILINKKKEQNESKMEFDKIQEKNEKAKNCLRKAIWLDMLAEKVRKSESKFQEEKEKLNFNFESNSEIVKNKKDDLEKQEKKLLKEIDDFEVEYKNLQQSDSQNSEKEIEVNKKLKEVKKEKEKFENKLNKINEFSTQLKKELENQRNLINMADYDPYIKLYEKYGEKLILEKIIKELKTFSEFLDEATIEYHKQKMEQINIILEQHWSNVYDESDIETIKILPELSESRNKLYNYRVVMVANGRELEMENRSSAGQKILACILIRIALFDIFAFRCPILVLDEPTATLDKDKVENLAEMLENLIKFRENNLQLIISTTNPNFVSRLYKVCLPEYYYGFSKDENGVSTLTPYEKI